MEKTLRLSAEQREDLVAYLDGELPDAKSQSIDQVLARSEVARHEVEALARTWEMLDVLPTPKAPPEFTERTMTNLKVGETPFDVTQQAWFGTVKKGAVALVWIAALTASAWFGFQITYALIANPSQQLLVDLPLIQKIDQYREVESVDFLDKLQKSRLFDDTSTEVKPPDNKTLPERHQQVVKMSQLERDRLQRSLAVFQELTPDQQSQYRQLGEQLDENRKGGGNLTSLMQTYTAWLQTLTPGQRESLRSEPDSARKLAIVQKIKEEQFRKIETISNNSPEWEPGVLRPFRQTLTMPQLATLMKAIVAELPEEQRIKVDKDLKPEQCLEILHQSARHAPEGPRSWPSTAVQDQILNILPPGRKLFMRENVALQRERLVQYLCLSILHNFEDGRPKFPLESDLNQVLNSLDADERSRIEKLLPEDRRHELQLRYFGQHERHRHELQGGLGRFMAEVGVRAPEPPRGPGNGGQRPPGRRPGEEGFDRPPPRGDGPPPRRDGPPPREVRPPRDDQPPP